MYIVQQILKMDDVIQFPLHSFLVSYPVTLQIGLLSAEVREYVYKSTQLVNREEETISHIVLSKDKQ
jgi:hypothetical protein